MTLAYEGPLLRIAPGTEADVVNELIATAPSGAIIEFSAGTHAFAETIVVERSDIWLRGEPGGGTELVGLTAEGLSTILRVGTGSERTQGTASTPILEGDRSFEIADHEIEPGDVIRIAQPDVSEFLEDPAYANVTEANLRGRPFLEVLVEVTAVDGDRITIADPLPYDIGEEAFIRKVLAVEDVRVSDLSLTFDLGAADPLLFENTHPDLVRSHAVEFYGTKNSEIFDVDVRDAASLSFGFRETIHLTGARLSTDGAHNKGGGGNGYGVELYESHYVDLSDLTLLDNRHAFLLQAWHSETNNTIHIAETNRDVNFHGGVDVGNVITVDRHEAYYGPGDEVWRPVSPGGDHHPATDIYGYNAVTFRHAIGVDREDDIRAHEDGGYLEGNGQTDTLYGNSGNDTLYGGSHTDTLFGGDGNDLISGDEGDDTLSGGAGRDAFVFGPDSGSDRIEDFDPAEDRIVLTDFASAANVADLVIVETAAGARLDLVAATGEVSEIFVANVSAADLRGAIELRRSADFSLDLNLTAEADRLAGGDGADLVGSYATLLSASDWVDLGGGEDRLEILSTSASVDLSGFDGIAGLDVIDISDVERVRLTLDDGTVGQSDRGRITLETGAAGIERLDTSGVSAGHFVILDGQGDVQLDHSVGQRIYANAGFTGRVLGGNLDDYIALSGTASIFAGRGDDVISVRAGASGRLFGDDGDDVFLLHEGVAGDLSEVSGGAGEDTALFYTDQEVTLEDLAGLRNFEEFEIRGSSAEARIRLDGATLARQNDAIAVIANAGALRVHAEGLEADQSVTLTGGADTTFTGGAQTIRLADGFTGSLDAGDGDDIIHSGAGDDRIDTGAGRDRILFEAGDGDDRLTGFDPAEDRLVLRNIIGAVSPETVLITTSGDTAVIHTGNGRITVENVSEEALRAALIVERDPGQRWEARLTSRRDHVFGDDDVDRVETYGSALTESDIVDLGGGRDHLEILSYPSFRLDWRGFDNLDGVDTIGLGGMEWAELRLDDAVLSGTDAGRLKLELGAAELRLLDLSAVSESYKVEASGSGDITLSDQGQQLFLNADYTGEVFGGDGDDDILVRGDFAQLKTGAGDDDVWLGTEAQVFVTLGEGDDLFDTGGGALLAGSRVRGGAGFDTLLLRDQGLADLGGVDLTGIDEIELRSAFNTITLPELSGPLLVTGHDANSAVLDTGGDLDTEIVFGRDLRLLTLEGGAQTVRTADGAEADLRAGDGDDVLIGGSGDDRFEGEAGDDDFTGGLGADRIVTGSGADTVRYAEGDGNDVVFDFDTARDRLVLTDLLSAASASDLQIRTVTDGVVLDLQGADGVSTIRLTGVDAADLAEAVEIRRSEDFRLNVRLTSGDDHFTGSVGADLVTTYSSILDAADRVAFGAGEDTLALLSSSYTLDLTGTEELTGLDRIDVSLADTARLHLGAGIVGASDQGVLTVHGGENGIARLDTSAVGDAGVVVTTGIGDVQLANDGQRVLHEGSGDVRGGKGADAITLAGSARVAEGGEGDDLFLLTDTLSRAMVLSGGAGADSFVFETADISATFVDLDTSVDRIILSEAALDGFEGSALAASLGVEDASADWILGPEALDALDGSFYEY